jgi:hypothetical protein
MKHPFFVKLGSATLALAFLANCSSTTVIRSTDPEAKIYVDGEFMGRGSVTYSDTKTVFASTMVRIQKPGCEPVTNSLSRSEFDVGACIGGVFVLVPFLWIEKYKSEYNYEYQCTPTSKGSQ